MVATVLNDLREEAGTDHWPLVCWNVSNDKNEPINKTKSTIPKKSKKKKEDIVTHKDGSIDLPYHTNEDGTVVPMNRRGYARVDYEAIEKEAIRQFQT